MGNNLSLEILIKFLAGAYCLQFFLQTGFTFDIKEK